MTKTKKTAQKAVQVRKALDRISETYGQLTRREVAYIMQDMPTQKISELTHSSVSSIAAVKANFTRGTYDWAFINAK
jgi:hypothetical protein